MLSCTYLAYIMQHLHHNVVNANMQEYVYMNLISHFPQKLSTEASHPHPSLALSCHTTPFIRRAFRCEITLTASTTSPCE